MMASMQLPSPPSTSHREEKENRPLHGHSSRVSWSQENQVHRLTSSSSSVNMRPSASYNPPVKSILRKVTSFPFTDMHCGVERDITPEPDHPLSHASYLAGPVSRIIAPDASLKDLIQAYHVLAARMRTCLTNETDVDASKPLFLPLKDNAHEFVQAIIRDLSRVMTDPNGLKEKAPKSTLPSPRPSPNKKKRGMNEEQVKYARDLGTTTHSVIKFLALLFSSPSLCQIFDDDHLNSILTQLLVIPMTDELPSPNARKTCALSISLLQVQRLPETVLGPAKDRIAYALRRGMDGELGKEGKKGSASDGLKAINDLSVYQPSLFVPTFTGLLPSVFANLLAPNLPLRVMACHALGGFVIGLTSLPRSRLHKQVSDIVADYLRMPPTTPSKMSSQESTIVRTLRTLLNNQDPLHSTHGPVWALSVIACFLVMLGPKTYEDSQLNRTFTALCSLAMRHRKSSVRALGCLIWRCIIWIYFQPPLITEDYETSENDDDEVILAASSSKQTDDGQRKTWWKLVQGVTEMGAGITTVIGLLAESHSTLSSERFSMIVRILSLMIRKGGPTCADALQILKKLLSSVPNEDREEQECSVDDWDWPSLIPKGLFCSYPNLLNIDFKRLSTVVKPLFDECLGVEDIRCLTLEELAQNKLFEGLVSVWSESLRAVEIVGNPKPPEEVLGIWAQILTVGLSQVKDSDSDGKTFAQHVSSLLTNTLSDPQIKPSPMTGWESDDLPTPSSSPSSHLPRTKPTSWPNSALKIFLVRCLWNTVYSVLPSELRHVICVELLGYLKEHHGSLVPLTSAHRYAEEDTRQQWGLLCAEVLTECDVSSVGRFLSSAKIFKNDIRNVKRWVRCMRGQAWRCYAAKQMDIEETWEENMETLLLPISSGDEPWIFSDEDVKDWEKLLSHTLNRALDNGMEGHYVLEQIAREIMKHNTPTWTSATRIVDLIISHLDVPSLKDMPLDLMELANYTLVSSYPPEPRNKVLSSWLIRSVTRVVDELPAQSITHILDKIQEGLSLWISDKYEVFTQAEYEFDLVMPYQTVMFLLQSQIRSSKALEPYADIIGSAFRGRQDKPAAIAEAFQEFWQIFSANTSEPSYGLPPQIQSALDALLPPYRSDNGLDCAINTTVVPTDEVVEDEGTSDLFVGNESTSEACIISAGIPAEELMESKIPGTPQTSPNRIPSTPTRRRKNHLSDPCLLEVEQQSPLQNLQRLPVVYHSSPKARRKGDKENIGTESVNYPTGGSVLGKRKLGDAIDDAVDPEKRKKTLIFHQQPHNQINDADGVLNGSMKSLEETSLAALTPKTTFRPKKRKVEYLDAVVVPTYQQVMEARRRAMASLRPPCASSPVYRPGVELRRTSPKTCLIRANSAVRWEGGMKKKKARLSKESDEDSSETELLSLHDVQVAGSDDSITLANKTASGEGSSDDDPIKLGNFTPRLVVSPSLGSRRVIQREQWDESDPASDDSVGPESPSKQVVERRQRKVWDTPRAAFADPLGHTPAGCAARVVNFVRR